MNEGNGQGINPGQVRIDPAIIKDAKLVKCDCGGAIFQEKMMLKRISKFASPTGQDELFPMNVLICDACGLVPTELNPGDMVPKEYLALKNDLPSASV